jgi:hypothetical protein
LILLKFEILIIGFSPAKHIFKTEDEKRKKKKEREQEKDKKQKDSKK